MIFLKKIIFILTILLLSGCATGPTYEDYISNKIEPIPEKQGRIFIYRTSTFGTAVQPSIKINNIVVGKAVPQGFFYVNKLPATYEVSAQTEVKRKVNLDLKSGEEISDIAPYSLPINKSL